MIQNTNLSLWFIRNFKVITNAEAKEIGLKHLRNVYGDEINRTNCRSIWVDNKQRQYRARYLELDEVGSCDPIIMYMIKNRNKTK